MDRRRPNTILALSSAAVAAFVALLGLAIVGGPPRPLSVAELAELAQPIDPPVPSTVSAVVPAGVTTTPDRSDDLDALASAGPAMADAAMDAAADTGGRAMAGEGGIVDIAEARGRARAKRKAIAMPYFSFAQGLRGTRS